MPSQTRRSSEGETCHVAEEEENDEAEDDDDDDDDDDVTVQFDHGLLRVRII